MTLTGPPPELTLKSENLRIDFSVRLRRLGQMLVFKKLEGMCMSVFVYVHAYVCVFL